MKRILLHKLVLSGTSKKDAVLEFKQGLNIITGDSDTGKTYAFQCVNYVLGGSSVPKEIDEAKGYSSVSLVFFINDKECQLTRIIGDNKINIEYDGEHYYVPCKHDSVNKNNLSRFLLSIISEQDDLPFLRQNNRGTKRTLSFRDLVHLCLIGETDILLEQSAFNTSNYTEQTVRKSVLKYVITGEDDSKDIANDKIADEIIRRAGVVQFLQNKEKELTERIEAIEKDETLALYEKTESTSKIVKRVSAIRLEIAQISENISKKEKEIQDLRHSCASDEAQINRFMGLLKHYKSELTEIESNSTYADFLSQLPRLACPICGQNIKRSLLSPENEEALFAYYKREREDLSSQVNDLEKTVETIKSRLLEKKKSLENHTKEKQKQEESVVSLQKRLNRYNKIIATQRHMDALQKALEIYREELISVKADIIRYSEKIPAVKALPSNSTISNYDSYCAMVKQVLINWGFPEDTEVTFDPDKLDLCLNGKSRISWGKGYRAFIMAAMTIGLMRYSYINNKLHPGFVILDSPLVSLKERKQDTGGEWVSDFMERKMIEDIIENDNLHQVIIFENKDLNYGKPASYLEFRHEGEYRRGFIEQ